MGSATAFQFWGLCCAFPEDLSGSFFWIIQVNCTVLRRQRERGMLIAAATTPFVLGRYTQLRICGINL